MLLIGISSVLVLFTGCTKNIPVIKYRDVYIPISCAVPSVDCNKIKYTLNSQQEELLLCIKLLREASKVCEK